MHQQRPHLRTAAASYAIGVGAAATASLFTSVRRSTAAVLTAVVLLAFALPASADAHAFLASSTPANGTSLARAPHVVSLRFSEAVSPTLTHIKIFDASGTERAGVRVTRGGSQKELRVTLPKLATGAYRIAYSTVSELDLHATRGAIVFGAGTTAPPIAEAASATPRTSVTETVAHIFDLVSLSLLIAVCALLASGLPAVVRARISRFALVALPALLLAGAVALAGKGSQFPLRQVLLSTDWGHAILVRELADRGRARRARAAAAEDRARAARARRARGGGERPCRVPRHRRDRRDRRAHPRRRRLGGRSDRARAGAARARAARRARLAAPFRPARRGQRRDRRGDRALQRRSPGREPRRAALDDLRLVARRQDRAARRDRRVRPARVSRGAPAAAVPAPARGRGDRGDRHAHRRVAAALERSGQRAAVRSVPADDRGHEARDRQRDRPARRRLGDARTGQARTSSRPRSSTRCARRPARSAASRSRSRAARRRSRRARPGWTRTAGRRARSSPTPAAGASRSRSTARACRAPPTPPPGRSPRRCRRREPARRSTRSSRCARSSRPWPSRSRWRSRSPVCGATAGASASGGRARRRSSLRSERAGLRWSERARTSSALQRRIRMIGGAVRRRLVRGGES